MKQYAVYDSKKKFLFNITAGSKDEALSLARKADRTAVRVELVIYESHEANHYRRK